MAGPLFTVITTTYNRRDLLPRAMRSVLGQTFPDFEYLVIDNGSTDDTAAVVNSIKDSRVRYVLNPSPTKSCDAPRNFGIQMAKGSIIAFLDDDDIWYPSRLEKVGQAFEKNPDADAVCHYQHRNENGKVTSVMEFGPWTDDIFEVLLYEKNCLCPAAVSIKAELLRDLGGFSLRKEFDAAGDYELWLRMAKRKVKIDYVKEPLGESSITPLNWSKADPAFESRFGFLIKHYILEYEKKPVFSISKRGMWRLCHIYLVAAMGFMGAGRYIEAISYFARAGAFMARRPTLIVNLFSKIKAMS